MTADGSSGNSSARDGAGGGGRSSSCAGVVACNRGGAASTVTFRDEDCFRGRWRGAVDAPAAVSGAGSALGCERTSGGGLGVAGGAITGSSVAFDGGATTDLDDSSGAGAAGYPDTGDLNTSKRPATEDPMRTNVTVPRAAGRN